MLALFILAPLAGVIILNLPIGKPAGRLAVAVTLVLSAAQAFVAVLASGAMLGDQGPLATSFTTLKADTLSRLTLMLIGVMGFVGSMVAAGTMSDRRQLFQFANVLLLAMIGMNGVALANDLFSLYVFLEAASIGSFVLIAMRKTSLSLEGAFKYIVMSAVASVLMVAAIAILIMVAGSTSFEAIRQAMGAGQFLTKVAVGAFICGLLVKGGLVPFHGWVVGAYSAAPAAVSVLLAGIISKVVGIYGLIRLSMSVFGLGGGLDHVLLAAGILSAVVGALAALGQSDLKRLLAWSSVSQMGYILLGLGCASQAGKFGGLDVTIGQLGLIGAVFHFFNHAIFKSQLFVNAAALEQSLGTTDMNQMGGVGARMPWTSVTSSLAALSTAGVPPLSGFWSKLIIIVALWLSGYQVLAGVAIAVSVLTLAYMLMMQRKVFFGQLRPGLEGVREAKFALVAPAVGLAAVTVVVGAAVPFFPNVFNAMKVVATAISANF